MLVSQVEKDTLALLRIAVPAAAQVRDPDLLRIVDAVRRLVPFRPPADSILRAEDVVVWLGLQSTSQLLALFAETGGPVSHEVHHASHFRAGDVSAWLDRREEHESRPRAV